MLKVKKLSEIQPKVVEILGYTKEIIIKYEKILNVYNGFKRKTPEERMISSANKWKNWLLNYKKRVFEEQIIAKTDKIEEKESFYNAKNRKKIMNKVNPAFILRNYLLEECIKKAEGGDYSEIDKLLDLIQDPFMQKEEKLKNEYCVKAPSFGTKICVSCSS